MRTGRGLWFPWFLFNFFFKFPSKIYYNEGPRVKLTNFTNDKKRLKSTFNWIFQQHKMNCNKNKHKQENHNFFGQNHTKNQFSCPKLKNLIKLPLFWHFTFPLKIPSLFTKFIHQKNELQHENNNLINFNSKTLKSALELERKRKKNTNNFFWWNWIYHYSISRFSEIIFHDS